MKAIVFDFDGTIVDSMNRLADMAADIMSRDYELSWNTAREQYVRTSGLPFHEQLETLYPGDGRNEKAAREFEESKKKWYLDSPLFRDTKSSIEKLKRKGFKVAVSSNNFQELVDALLSRHGLEVDMALGYRSEDFAKGEAHFKYIAKKFSLSPDDIVFVGDSLKDGDRAKQSGVRFIAKEGLFTKSQFKNEHPEASVITTLNELENII